MLLRLTTVHLHYQMPDGAFGSANEPWPTTSHSSSQPCLFTIAIFLIVMCMEVCILNDFLALIQVNPKFPARDLEVLKKKKKKKKKNPSKPIPLCVESIAIAEQLHPCQVLWKVSLLTDKFIWYVSSNAKITKCRKLWQTDLFLDVFFFLDWLVKFRCDWVFCCCFFNYRANEVRFFQIIFMKMQTEKNMYTLCFQWKLLTTMYCFQAGSSWRDEEKNSYQYWYHTVRVGVVCVCVYISIFISIFIYHMADLYHINLCTVHNSPSSQAHR